MLVQRLDFLNESYFIQRICLPLVERLGYDYSEDDSADTSLLRTLAITQAALAGDEK